MQNANGLPSLAPLLRDVTPAVVNISVLTRAPVETNPLFSDPFFRYFFEVPKTRQARPQRSAGSGVMMIIVRPCSHNSPKRVKMSAPDEVSDSAATNWPRCSVRRRSSPPPSGRLPARFLRR